MTYVEAGIRAIAELDGNVMTHTRPLTQDERLRIWWVKWNIILLEGKK